jgi:hypothetical protein
LIQRAFITYGAAAAAPDDCIRVGSLQEASAAVRSGVGSDVVADCGRVPELGEPVLTFRVNGLDVASTGVAAYCARNAAAGTFLLSSGGNTRDAPELAGASLSEVENRLLRALSELEGRSLPRDLHVRSRSFLTRRNAGLSRLRCRLRLLMETGAVDEHAGRAAVARISELLRTSRSWV